MIRPSRRRLLTVMGAAAGMTLSPGVGSTNAAPRWTWRGTALGANAEMTLVHPDEGTARKLIRIAVDEIERLENIFSLYRLDSEIARLNRDGHLYAPSPDLVALLSIARQVSELTEGAFDITVQPLWRLYADHFAQPDADPNGPSDAVIAAARRLVDYKSIDVTSSHIRFARPRMAITLNGIAQGFITDRVADLLRAHGIEQTLIALGEIRALGTRPDGRPWQVAIDGEESEEPIPLIDKAIATSSPKGTVFERSGRFHHLLNSVTGRPSSMSDQLSVVAERAAFADALSTGLVTMSAEDRVPLLRQVPDVLVYRSS